MKCIKFKSQYYISLFDNSADEILHKSSADTWTKINFLEHQVTFNIKKTNQDEKKINALRTTLF